MPQPNTNQLVSMTSRWEWGSRAAEVTRWFRNATGPNATIGASGLVTLANGINNTLKTQLQSLQPTVVSLVSTTGRQYLTNGSINVGVGTTDAYTGTNAANPLPPATSGIVTLYTASSGRSYRGRTYWPWFTEADNDAAGAVSAAVQTAMLNCSAIEYAGAGADLVPVILSRTTDNWYNVSTKVARGQWATQRRRKT